MGIKKLLARIRRWYVTEPAAPLIIPAGALTLGLIIGHALKSVIGG